MKERLESKTKEQLIEMLIKANRRRKEETSLWRRKAKVLGWKLEAERKANAKQETELRGWISHWRGKVNAMQQNEAEYNQWRYRVNQLVDERAQAYKDLFTVQTCSACDVKKRNKRYFAAVFEFMTKYIHIVDDLLRQKNLPDNVKARLSDMRIAISDSRAYMKDLRRKQNLE